MRVPWAIGLVTGVVLLPTLVVATTDADAGSCGVYRRPVKQAIDDEAAFITVTPKLTTIARLRARAVPAAARHSDAVRQPVTEFLIFRVTGVHVREAALEDDGDYHVVIENAAHRSMIIELVDPACAPSSRFADEYDAARTSFSDYVFHCLTGRDGHWLQLRGTASVNGVGFFDAKHHQHGLAPNGIELHPVLKFSGSC